MLHISHSIYIESLCIVVEELHRGAQFGELKGLTTPAPLCYFVELLVREMSHTQSKCNLILNRLGFVSTEEPSSDSLAI
jgi:hypothetical protein